MQNTSLCAIKRYSIILTLILTVYIIPYQTEGKSCNEFKCPLSPLNTKLSKNNFNCSQKSSNPKTPKSSIFYVSSCPYATQECNFSPKNLNSVCEYPKSQFPGENCTSDQECLSGECNMRKCAGKSIGSACKSTGECDVHAFCNNSRCYPLAVLNEGCKIDGECDAFYVCINYKCLLLGAVVSGSVSATTTMACSTFYGVYNALGQLRCVEGPTLNGGYTDVYQASCNLGDLCRYSTTNLLLTDVCYCGANPNGNSYCQPGRGDLVQEIADFLAYVQGRQPECHKNNPFFCSNALHNIVYYKAYVAMQKLTSYPSLIDNDQCTQESLNTQYWNAVQFIEEHDHPKPPTPTDSYAYYYPVFICILAYTVIFAII